MAKFIFIVVFIALVIFGINYISNLGKSPAQCPTGERFARAVTGGWADTDPTDPWGKCVPVSQIGIAPIQ